MSRTVKQITSDRTFDIQHEEHVTKTNRLSVSFQLRDNNVVVSGEEGCVNMIEANPDMTIAELKKAMMENVDIDDKYKFKSTSTSLPPLCSKFRGPSWNTRVARQEVSKYFAILGFGKKGTKYTDNSNVPDFWPDSLAYSTFQHPSKEKLDTLNIIMEAILLHFQLDPETHHTEILPEVDLSKPVRKKKKPAKSKQFIDSNSDGEDDKEESSKPNTKLKKVVKSQHLFSDSDTEDSDGDLKLHLEMDSTHVSESSEDSDTQDEIEDSTVGYKSQKRKRKEVQRLLKQPITDMPDIPKSQYELNMEKNVEEKKKLLDTLEIDLD